ncbi:MULTISPECIES: type I restriction endonuclease subunit R [Rhodanobacter]|uniref:type I restriction endonuclease subunit R n=1 Tax=Rhodanobacter TaxID=75309 RepID=UPI0003FB4472|nr:MULTISPECIES: HsdR family type I site-specific deoxyribonuclease [Rhodanobacter]TAN18993.1 MAG: HsdR family type I site-specific deoxyribonuclease [Rhodanobacter sp.]UJJ56421.1 HsdR family type I site-specific deoxyribonuclease [Rhodanobacter thiooxydans]
MKKKPEPFKATKLAVEATTVQFPLVDHAAAAGWARVNEADALRKRRGEGGLFFYDELEAALLRLNPGVVTPADVPGIVQRLESLPNTIVGNREVLDWLRGKKTIYVDSEKRQRNVRLVDYDNATGSNIFQVTWEWAYRNGTRKGNRADVVFVINGMPVAIVENKNPKSKDAMSKALVQLRRYELETPEMLTSPQVFNITHLIEYFYGVTWNTQRKFVFNWKEEQPMGRMPKCRGRMDAQERPGNYEDRVKHFFEHARFLRMLRDWILFFEQDDELRKTILRQHQTRAAIKVAERCADPAKRSGLVWHTQGSGKTFTMVTAARLMLENPQRFAGATVLLVVDRNELEGQLSGWVDALLGDLQGSGIAVELATSKKRLKSLLKQEFSGLIVTMIHKFDKLDANLSTRSNVYVLIDEAHRSTGGDLGNYLMGALPHATLIGFTGTPVDKTAYGKGTFKTFGREDTSGYLDKYSIAESVADGTTVRLRHTLAPARVLLPVEKLEQEFYALAESEGISDINDLNRILDRAVNLRAFLKSDQRVDEVARFVAQHFRENVEPLGYKAFLVGVDREACALYKQALDKYLPADYSVPVYTSSAADAIDYPLVASHQIDAACEKRVRKLFRKPGQQPKILIVTDKLLTGYDAPILYAMYLDKPMRDHVLLQAISRVNRPYEDAEGRQKPGGLIVDFIGMLRDLNKALAFDSQDVSGVIEDLDLLLAEFRRLLAEAKAHYLAPLDGGKDKQLETMLYDVFLAPEARQEFIDSYRQIESLYEILSPSPELREHVEDFRQLADLYLMMRNAYSSPSRFYEDVAHKTEQMVREMASSYAPVATGKTVEFDLKTLQALRSEGDDNATVINLVRAIETEAEEQTEQQPVLVDIAQRATAILDALEQRTIHTQQAIEQLSQLVGEREQADVEREKLGLDPSTFAIYWYLHGDGIKDALPVAHEIMAAAGKYPNHRENDDERRQLKSEIYRSLVTRGVDGAQMVRLGEAVLRILRD